MIITEEELKIEILNGFGKTEICEKYKITLPVLTRLCKKYNLTPIKKCGCKNKPKDMYKKEFGSLKVTENWKRINDKVFWECECKCGNKDYFCGADLRQGKIKTCGCRIGIISRRNYQGYEGIPKSKWRVLQRNALQRDLEFTITIEEIWNLYLKQNGKCKISGLEINFNLQENTASLDRIDCKKGYIIDNIQWVHKDINKLKGMFSDSRLIELCKIVSKNNE